MRETFIAVDLGGGGAGIWDEVSGIRSLQDVAISDYGLGDDLDGWELINVWGISYDGSTLVGPATNPDGKTEGYIVHLGDGTPQPGITVAPTVSLETSEDDVAPSASFTVVLDTEPMAPVTINVSSSDESEGVITGATNLSQLEDNLGSREHLDRLDNALLEQIEVILDNDPSVE